MLSITITRKILVTALFLASFWITCPLAYAEITNDRLVSVIDRHLLKGEDGYDASQFALSEDRQFLFYVWDNHVSTYRDGISTLHSHLAVYDISNMTTPRLVLEKNLGRHVVLNAIVRGSHLFLRLLNPTDASSHDWKQSIVIYDIKFPTYLHELDRLRNSTPLTQNDVSPDGKFLKTMDNGYYNISSHKYEATISRSTDTQPWEKIKFEYIEGQLVTDKLGPYALTIGNNDDCTLWDRSLPDHPFKMRHFTLGISHGCYGKIAPDPETILIQRDFQLQFYSTLPLAVTAQRMRQIYAAEQAEFETNEQNLQLWDRGYGIENAISQLDNAGIDVLINDKIEGMDNKESADILTNYAHWIMLSHKFHGADNALPALRKAVQLSPDSMNPRAMLGDVAITAAREQNTDTAKAKLWDEARSHYAIYRGLSGTEPHALKDVFVDDPFRATFHSHDCIYESYQIACGYHDAMAFNMSELLTKSKDVCEYISEVYKHGNPSYTAASSGSFNYQGQEIKFSIEVGNDSDDKLYLRMSANAPELMKLPGMAPFSPSYASANPVNLIPFKDKYYFVTFGQSHSPMEAYEPIQGKVCSF